MKLVFLSLLCFLAANVWAQPLPAFKYLEAGLMLGGTNYSGDVAEKIIVLKETRFSFNIFARYHFSRRFALKWQLGEGFVGGSDANAISPNIKARSLRFKSRLLETALTGEWNFMDIKPDNRNDIQQLKVVPYLFIGVGGMLVKSKVNYYGPLDEFDTRVHYPLPEPGLQNKALIFPFGLGARARISKRVSLGIEGAIRTIFSDYLDGVKKNGIPNRDWYYTANAVVAMTFDR